MEIGIDFEACIAPCGRMKYLKILPQVAWKAAKIKKAAEPCP